MNGSANKENRIWFLQLCRAVACILVVYVHWTTFIINPNPIFDSFALPHLSSYPNIPLISQIVLQISHYIPSDFREAFFGIGLFFLISGFVIPFSMGKTSPYEFLFRRFMRIYPTLFVCILIAAILLLSAEYLCGSKDHVIFKQVIGNIFLIREQLRVPYIEFGVWTLEIELRFYFLCFFLAFFSGHKKGWILLLLPQLIFLISGSLYAAFISFMFVGTCLFNWTNSGWSGKKTIFCIMILMMISRYYLIDYFGGKAVATDTAISLYTNHIYALLIFVVLLSINHKLIYSKIMDKIADISYSIYLVHGTAAYSIYFISYYLSHSIMISILSAALWIVLSSIVIHAYIEKPSIEISKKIVNWFKAKQNSKKELLSVNPE